MIYNAYCHVSFLGGTCFAWIIGEVRCRKIGGLPKSNENLTSHYSLLVNYNWSLQKLLITCQIFIGLGWPPNLVALNLLIIESAFLDAAGWKSSRKIWATFKDCVPAVLLKDAFAHTLIWHALSSRGGIFTTQTRDFCGFRHHSTDHDFITRQDATLLLTEPSVWRSLSMCFEAPGFGRSPLLDLERQTSGQGKAQCAWCKWLSFS
ncbi:hypothetical protein CDL12_02893 [Handroanthus impetiginosus]|uniref:Uncharacterized protein n=1 Tax=Handroanthus impetiginosus TaxID=429701 RepID=A0A2G9I425_9LAMI|nr:hypothetical protein CDL12_02893 [Handroanthus impetiginosus]